MKNVENNKLKKYAESSSVERILIFSISTLQALGSKTVGRSVIIDHAI